RTTFFLTKTTPARASRINGNPANVSYVGSPERTRASSLTKTFPYNGVRCAFGITRPARFAEYIEDSPGPGLRVSARAKLIKNGTTINTHTQATMRIGFGPITPTLSIRILRSARNRQRVTARNTVPVNIYTTISVK